MNLPGNHPQRVALNDEVHARPPEPLEAPCRVSYLVLLGDAREREASWAAVCQLAETCGVAGPDPGANHFSADLRAFRLKWERHTEFVRFSFFVAGAAEDTFEKTALSAAPADWVAGLPGSLLVAAHVIVTSGGEQEAAALRSRLFGGEVLVGSRVSSGAGLALTNFRIYPDGFSRMLLVDESMAPRQAGRVCQRLLEIDTYRMMALLALPVAQGLGPAVAKSGDELARITGAMMTAGEADEPMLLERLTRLAAEIDSRQAKSLFRFSSAAAYDEIVQRRIDELREQRIVGLQTLREFTERRMAPAMSTCRSVAGRQEELSRRVARATQLLATRVQVTRERQSQELLVAMNRRAALQLRLQATVEGLSVAAITYYVVSLVGYLAKGAAEAGWLGVRPEVAMAVSVPVVAGLMAFGLRRARRHVRVDV